MRRIALAFARSVLVFALVGVATGCSADTTAVRHPAAVAVRGLLELRSAGSTDATAYAPYLADRSLADALAGSADPGRSAVPGWDAPYVSALSSQTADVVVKWHADTKVFPDWPAATVFSLKSVDGRWVVVDALDPTGAVPGPASAAELRKATLDTVGK